MAGFERAKRSLDIQAVPQQRVDNLQQDLSNLMGVATKGLNDINTIGETAAKLEANTMHQGIVSNIQALKLRELDLAPDDVESRKQISDEISGYNRELSSKLSEFSNHKAAYDAFSSASADTSYVIGQEHIGAVSRFNEANNLKLTNTVKSNLKLGLTVSNDIMKTNIGILKTEHYTED